MFVLSKVGLQGPFWQLKVKHLLWHHWIGCGQIQNLIEPVKGSAAGSPSKSPNRNSCLLRLFTRAVDAPPQFDTLNAHTHKTPHDIWVMGRNIVRTSDAPVVVTHNTGMDAVSLKHTLLHCRPLIFTLCCRLTGGWWAVLVKLFSSVFNSPALHLKVGCHDSVLGTASWVK